MGHTKHHISTASSAVNRSHNLDCLPPSALYVLANYSNLWRLPIVLDTITLRR